MTKQQDPIETIGEASDVELIIGTYEDYVIGYQLETIDIKPKKKLKSNGGDKVESAKKNYSLEQSFAVRAHSGSVRCLCTNENGTLALSAGFDEMINLFGLKKRKLLQTSEAAVNCTVFAGKSHLICGSEDGNIYIYECKASSMAQVKTLKGHKEAVTSLSVHPSNKILLSLSKDKTIRTWNLIKGRSAYVTNIRSHAHLVCWSKTGDEFMIAANNEIYLYNNSGYLEHSIKLEKRVNSVEFISDNIFVVATDSGKLEFFDLKEGKSLMTFGAHESRIKCIRFLRRNDDEEVLFATASSDGIIKLWSTTKPGKDEPQSLAEVDTGARLTCMTSAIREEGA